jgi:uncharacterized protein YgbK (DUF1537 family)
MDVIEPAAPSIAFYADDFTGATDTLATAARAGLRSMLFLRPPTAAQRQQAGPLDCLGIAGAARSMQAQDLEKELLSVGRYLARLGAPVTHYKTCSTFDSSPETGSIGLAARTLRVALGSPRFIPVVGGQPNLGRYCVFGNLFAAYRTGREAYRLDRHPTMSRHPVTPMDEADLRLHLARQGMARMSSIQYPDYGRADFAAEVERAIDAGPDGVLFDIAAQEHLPIVGRVLWRYAKRERLLAVGASSVVAALAEAWEEGPGGERKAGMPVPDTLGEEAAGPVFVLSGSLSPLTASQIAAAVSYRKLPIQAETLLSADAHAREALLQEIVRSLGAGENVLAHLTGSAAHDPAALARASGLFLSRVLAAGIRPWRVGVAGGDTSSHAIQALDVWGLSYRGQLDHGAALCRLHSGSAQLAGIDVMLKGGQMGAPDIFERLAGARLSRQRRRLSQAPAGRLSSGQ